MGELHKTYTCKTACLLQIPLQSSQVREYKFMSADVAPASCAVWKLLEIS